MADAYSPIRRICRRLERLDRAGTRKAGTDEATPRRHSHGRVYTTGQGTNQRTNHWNQLMVSCRETTIPQGKPGRSLRGDSSSSKDAHEEMEISSDG
eukprot:5264287-Amphidinium_carterae.1